MHRLTDILLILTFALASLGAGFYSDDPHIYLLTPRNFDKVVYNTNYTTIVEFYAPWCGYCKQLKPVFQKLGRFIQGNAKYAVNVAAVDCDQDVNKPLCSQHRVLHFPTLKVFRPPKFQRGKVSTNKHVPEVYNGQRDLAPMVEYLNTRMKNYVKKFHSFSDSLGEWLNVDDGTQKAVIVSNSKTISPLARSLAIDFLDSLSLASVSLKENNSSFEYEGIAYDAPVSDSDQLPVLLAYDKENRKFVRYNGNINSMSKLQKFLMKTLNIVPSEGHLSKRDKSLKKYRGVPLKDEL